MSRQSHPHRPWLSRLHRLPDTADTRKETGLPLSSRLNPYQVQVASLCVQKSACYNPVGVFASVICISPLRCSDYRRGKNLLFFFFPKIFPLCLAPWCPKTLVRSSSSHALILNVGISFTSTKGNRGICQRHWVVTMVKKPSSWTRAGPPPQLCIFF